MKIVIVGGGLTGLSTYIHLKKHLPESASQDITIYERHASSIPPGPTEDNRETGDGDKPREAIPTIGGGLGLAANGMRVLKYLSPELHSRVVGSGFPTSTFEMRTASGTKLGEIPASSEVGNEQITMSSWRALWEELRKEIPSDEKLKSGKKVSEVGLDGTIRFEDGETIKADLIIAADGARSICRKAVMEKGEKGDAEFQGLMNFGGFIPTAQLPKMPPGSCDVVMTFGRRGFFGYTPAYKKSETSNVPIFDRPTHMWWSTYQSATPEAPDPASAEARKTIQHLFSECTDPVIQYLINNATPEISTPTWTVPKLPRWHKGRIILIGDAAHGLPSTSGQGVSQGFEDAVTLAILLAAALKSPTKENLEDETISEVGNRYMKLRKKRVEDIRDEAVRMQGTKKEMGQFQVYIAYAFIWLWMKMGSTEKVTAVIDYDAKAVADNEVKLWKEDQKL